MKIPFVGGSGTARSPDADSERTVNAYVEMDDGNPRAPAALYGMPGLVLAHQFGGGPIRASIQCGTFTYFVSGSQVYRRNALGDWIQLTGSLATSQGLASMASNGREILIADGTHNLWSAVNPPGYGEGLGTGDLILAPDVPDLPFNINGVAWIAGYWVAWGNSEFTDEDNEKFFWRNDTALGGEWDGLDFATVNSNPDALVAGVADHGQLWFVGTDSAEVFTAVTDPDLPLQRSGSGFQEFGTIAAQSVRSFDNSVVWLSRNEDGLGMFIRTQGGNPVRFSNHKVETALAGYSVLDDAIAFTFQMEGHNFYVCTFPTADATWCYDAASSQWAEWLWRDPADGTLHRHRAQNHVLTLPAPGVAAKHLVGDRTNGNVYELRMDAYTDDGDPILFRRRTPNVFDEASLLTMQELRIDLETGVANPDCADPKLKMRYYKDGRTPGNWKEKSIGLAGQFLKQVRFHALGQAHAWSFEIEILDPVKRAILGGYARVVKSRGGS